MDRPDDRRLGQRQEVVVAPKVARMVSEPGVAASVRATFVAGVSTAAAESSLVELVGLDERAHRPVDHEDPLGEQGREEGGPLFSGAGATAGLGTLGGGAAGGARSAGSDVDHRGAA